jgi:hypothetical protein
MFGWRFRVRIRKAAILAVALFLVGCATITKGTTQLVAVDTPGVPGATALFQPQADRR